MSLRYKSEPACPGRLTVLAVTAAMVFISAGLASAGTVPTPRAGIPSYGSPVCGKNWVPVNLGSGDYLNVYNGTHSSDYTCVKVPTAGRAAWSITKVVNPVSWWLYPNISAGWEWGRYTCNDGRSASPSSPGSRCMRFPVRTGSMGRVHASMRMSSYPQTGRYNVSWDIWFSKTAKTPVYQNDAAEIMIWVGSRNIRVLHQRKVYIDSHWWWVEYWNVKRSGVTWKLTVFSLVHPLTVVTNMYIDPLVSWVARAGRVSLNDYLTAIDFGAEISAGTPLISFSNYSLTGVR